MRKLVIILTLSLALISLSVLLIVVFKPSNQPMHMSGTSVSLEVRRLEDMLFALNTKEDIIHLLQKNQLFSQKFLKKMMLSDEKAIVDKLYIMTHDPGIKELYQEVKSVFGDLAEIKDQLEQAFQHIQYYYPNFKIPQVTTFITGMGMDLYISNDLIVIGLDFFLGKNARYKPCDLPQYILETYQPAYIVPKIIFSLSQHFNTIAEEDHSLLADMIYYGKSCYFTQTMLPNVPDNIIIGYTEKQLEDTKKHHNLIWEYFIEHELLYRTNHLIKNKYLGNRPFTAEIGTNCPGNIGGWLGWQIIKQYMKANTKIALPTLMSSANAQELFGQSKYRPSKCIRVI